MLKKRERLTTNFILFFRSFLYFIFDINHLDGRPASPKCNTITSSPVVTPPATTKFATCCNCFGPLKSQWDDAISNQMSEVYCRVCDTNEDDLNGEFVPIPKDRLDSPAILTNVTQRRRRTLPNPIIHQKRIYSHINGDSDVDGDDNNINITTQKISTMISTATAATTSHEEEKLIITNKNSIEDYELGDDVVTNSEFEHTQKNVCKAIDASDLIRVRGKEELVETEIVYRKKSTESKTTSQQINVSNQINNNSSGIEYLEKEETNKETNISKTTSSKNMSKRSVCSKDHPLLTNERSEEKRAGESFNATKIETQNECKNRDNSETSQDTTARRASENISFLKRMHNMYSTLPKMKKNSANQNLPTTANGPHSIPMRITSDGTTIYYICDLPKNVIKGVIKLLISIILINRKMFL